MLSLFIYQVIWWSGDTGIELLANTYKSLGLTLINTKEKIIWSPNTGEAEAEES